MCVAGVRASSSEKKPGSRKSNMEMWLEESSSDDDFVESDGEDERRRADQAATDTDHWLIQKLIRYIKVSSPSRPALDTRWSCSVHIE